MTQNSRGLTLLADHVRLSNENHKLRSQVSRLELRVAALHIDVTNLEEVNLRLQERLTRIKEVINDRD